MQRITHASKLSAAPPRRGAVIVLLVIMLPVLLILAAYAINIAYVEAVSTETQIAADAAAHAAGRTYVQTGDRNAALAAARDAVTRNPVSGVTLPLNMSDLEFGVSRRDSLAQSYQFTPLGSPTQAGNAVRLTTRTTANSPTPVFSPLFPTMGVNLEIRPERVAVSTQSTMDVALVIDRSGSMAFASNEVTHPTDNPASAPPGWVYGDPVPPNSRWLDLVASVSSFNNYLNNSPQLEKLCLATYSHESSRDQELTTSYGQVMSALDSHSFAFHGGATSIGLGLESGLASLKNPAESRSFAVKVMVLMTDGRHNQDKTPEQMINALQNEGVTLFAITFSDEADQPRMLDLATACGGEHFHAVDATQLQAAFHNIAKKLPSLLTQ